MSAIPAAWRDALASAVEAPWFRELSAFVAEERRRGSVFPADEHVFEALARTAPDRVRVVVLGQDPYHGAGQAHGLAFSVPRGVPRPPSLVNVFRELRDDLGLEPPAHGCLEAWADRGVLLLNTVLTVREGEAGSHAGKGWERFTDAVIRALAACARPIVFVLWGAHAQKKAKLVEASGRAHRVLRGVHPSPLSAHRGFFGSRPFSAIDAHLRELHGEPMDWRL